MSTKIVPPSVREAIVIERAFDIGVVHAQAAFIDFLEHFPRGETTIRLDYVIREWVYVERHPKMPKGMIELCRTGLVSGAGVATEEDAIRLDWLDKYVRKEKAITQITWDGSGATIRDAIDKMRGYAPVFPRPESASSVGDAGGEKP